MKKVGGVTRQKELAVLGRITVAQALASGAHYLAVARCDTFDSKHVEGSAVPCPACHEWAQNVLAQAMIEVHALVGAGIDKKRRAQRAKRR